MTKVSVIIPIYNVELYLRECLDSVVNQTLKDIEILCVDDCSSDNSLAILKEYALQDDRIVVVKQDKNQGAGVARNRAIDIAKGDYIMFLDGDDFYELNACEVAYNQVSRHDNDIAFFNINNYDNETGKKTKASYRLKSMCKYSANESFYLYDLKEPFITGAEAVYKIYNREFLIKNNIKFSGDRFAEDVPFYFGVIASAGKVSVNDVGLYNYRKFDNSSCTTCARLSWKYIFNAREKSLEIINKSEHAKDYLPLVLPYFINSIMYWYDRWSKIKGFQKKEYYNEMHKFFKMLKENHPQEIEDVKEFINYHKFKHIVKEDWNLHCLSKFLKEIFSVNNEKKHKVIRILGIKIKFKKHIQNKKYKELSKNYTSHIKRITQKIKNGEKIRVAFYVNDNKWKCQSLFDVMQKNPHYEPFVLVGKNDVSVAHTEYQRQEDIEAIYNGFTSKGMQAYYAYNFENEEHIPLENFNPDIVFFSRQFGLAPIYKIENVGKNFLTCYVPYFIPNSPLHIEAGYDFHNLLWRYYVINQDTVKEYAPVMYSKGKNLRAVGYPELDPYLEDINYEKGYVIYAPHWSLGNTPLKYATFDWNGEYILEFAKAHPEIKWVFKPHPILKNHLVNLNIMTQEEADNYWAEWAKIGIVYEGPDYLDLFKKSKALITDCGSFLAEYMPTKNPVILLRSKRATAYNFLAKKVTKYYYSVWNIEQLQEQLDKVVLQGRDPWKERRLAMLESLHLITNASQNIIDDLNKEFGIK